MPDDALKRGTTDASRINGKGEHELRYWAEKFGVTKEQLREAVKVVGVNAESVRGQLSK